MTHSALNKSIKYNDLIKALTAFMLDTVAIASRANYEDRRLKQSEGIAKAKANGTKSGKPIGGIKIHNDEAIVNWKNSSGSSIVVTASHFEVSKSTVNRAMRKYK
ncbi:recombinase family protein [Colwellia sp. BRX8-7]|jgi:DNA invertase Pin-like site-specific DNA recombinase|uniref:recombinase family protein n=1 Tax=Colwellia sp. BRX8-7 TaxID=2759833 RepID=UPI0015F740C0|nr:recombinase family protein [Colwellia sp. BRX8-7]MBA6337144.1 recombinase family protein [Colwellia sp. BRX8-7]